VACLAGRGRVLFGGLPGVAAGPAEVLDGVAGDPLAGDLASVLIPGEERGGDRGAGIRSWSCPVRAARGRGWSWRSRWPRAAWARRWGSSRGRDGLVFVVSPSAGPAAGAAGHGGQAPGVLAGRGKAGAVPRCPAGGHPAGSPVTVGPWWGLPSWPGLRRLSPAWSRVRAPKPSGQAERKAFARCGGRGLTANLEDTRTRHGPGGARRNHASRTGRRRSR
jgi:hypothetical protein